MYIVKFNCRFNLFRRKWKKLQYNIIKLSHIICGDRKHDCVYMICKVDNVNLY